jgi:P-type Ca2+ transporter type 2C
MQAETHAACCQVDVRVRSALPGRFRIWVAGLYHNAELERALLQGLQRAERTIVSNHVAATLLVTTERHARAEELVAEIEALVRDFAASRSTSLAELEWRGRVRPLHLVRGGAPPGVRSGFVPRSQKRKQGRGPDATLGEEQLVQAWHTLEARRVVEMLQVDPARGLSATEADARLQRFRQNVLSAVERRSGLAMFVDQFKELPVALLAGSTVLSMLTGGVADGVVILGVIVINGVIGYITENTAERTIASLTKDDAPEVDVIREGEALRISRENMVPGDLFILRPGSVVPADGRVVRACDLTIDESALTGESMPVNKSVAAIADPELPLGERTNMVYRGTLVTGGSGSAVAIATGRATQVGQLQTMVGEVVRPETPMQKQLRHLGERTVIVAGVVCGGVLGIGLLRGQAFGAMMRTAVSLAVAAVPEGLPTVAITTLALGIRKMKEQHVLVRRLDAIETLGSVQVLCFDKTGTITENRMRVVQAGAAHAAFKVDGGKVFAEHGELQPAELREFEWLMHVGALCSEAGLVDNRGGPPSARGSSTEAALVEFALAAGVDVAKLRGEYPMHRAEHRTEARKWMATLHRAEKRRGGYLVALKGAPTEVLDMCQFWMRDGQVLPLSERERQDIRRQNERMAGEALRVLGMAYAEHDTEPESVQTNLIWLGMLGLADPPRAGLAELFVKFRRAGVKSVMITGDQSATAYAVAKQIGLDVDGELQTLDSIELEKMEPEVLAELAPRVQVFSRVSPRHKLRIVQALQKAGLVVAMTGDGINDCPALKASDIGVAMGGGPGTVAREVADVILETDELAAMLTAIEHGRVIHADIKKAVRFILATNLSEIMLTFLSVAAGFGEGMSPMQLLWINLVSDIFPELALALQPGEQDVLEQPPRDPTAKMFSGLELRHMAMEGSLLTLGALAVYGYGIRRYGLSPRARSLSFVALSSAQLLHAFSTRSERHNIFDANVSAPNPYLPLSVGGGIALTILMQLLPPTRQWLGAKRAISSLDWAVAATGAIGPLLANELVKALRFSLASASLATNESRPTPAPASA